MSILNADTGSLLRTIVVNRGGAAAGAAAVANQRRGRNFIVNSNSVSILDAHSGAVLHTIGLGMTLGPATISERANRMFVVSQETNVVIMLDATTGRKLRITALGSHAGFPVIDERRNCVFIAGTDGSRGNVVDVLDASSGRLMRSIAVRGDAKAVDEVRGRVVVLNGFGTVSLLDASASCTSRTRK